MEEVVCAERSGFPFGPGAWPEFWTLLFLSSCETAGGARCERVGSSSSVRGIGLPLASCSSRSCVSSSRTKLARGVWSVRAVSQTATLCVLLQDFHELYK